MTAQKKRDADNRLDSYAKNALLVGEICMTHWRG
jgi:hypothetical protein